MFPNRAEVHVYHKRSPPSLDMAMDRRRTAPHPGLLVTTALIVVTTAWFLPLYITYSRVRWSSD
jgi:hypothetical protein